MTAAGLLDQLVSLFPSNGLKAVTGDGFRSSSMYPQLSSVIRDPLRLMRLAQDAYLGNRHIRGAERTISQRFATVPYHLEDGEGNRVGVAEGENDDPAHLAVLELLERPYRPKPGDPIAASPRTRSQLWGVGCRHVGCAGMAYWFLDELDMLAGTPLSILYINPCRMKPATDAAGNLVGWVLDPDSRKPTPLEVREVIPFSLEPPDHGHLSAGLVETAMSMVDLTRLGDRHAAGVLASGGRLAGFIAPKGDNAFTADVYDQLVLDFRRAAEDPESARRMNIIKGPTEFTRMSATPSELDLVAVMNLSRDEVAELWGVPRSQKGGTVAQGLNSGETKGYDEAILWQNAVGPRLRTFAETVQTQLLDRWKAVGVDVTLVIEEPEFDDETPMYERASKATTQPLTNRERRELLGLEPFGDERDDEVWMASTMTRVYPEAEEPEPAPPPFPTVPEMDQADVETILEDEPPPLKAEPAALQRAIADVLRRTGEQVAARVEYRMDHLRRKPTDVAAVLDVERMERELAAAMRPHLLRSVYALPRPTKADLRDEVIDRLLSRVGLRIKGIADTTRQKVADAIRQGLDEGLGAAALGDRIEATGAFGELRAETIARTESGTVLNEAAVEQYREFGVTQVIVSDGDDDEACASADGQVWTLEQAHAAPLAHPNCTRAFAPMVGGSKAEGDPMADALLELARAVAGRPDPVVNVGAPVVNLPAPVVNVEGPIVNIPAPIVTVEPPALPEPVVNIAGPVVNVPTPSVTFQVPEPGPRVFAVQRDPQGRISTIIEG